jgi:FkbM family methyltransferase
VDPLAGAIRVIGKYSPRLANTMYWQLELRRGGFSHRLVDALVKKREVVVDIGANDGVFTHRLAQLVGREGHVHAFEPNPACVERLRGTIGRRRNITLHACALSDEPREGELYVPRPDGELVRALGRTTAPRGEVEYDTISISLLTLDAALEAHGRPVSFIKCDVEGHEQAVLRGAGKTLAQSRPTLLVEIEQRHREDDIGSTFGWLRELGYSGYAVREDALAPLDDFNVQRDQLALLPDEVLVKEVPTGYVNDFLFVSSAVDVTAFLALAGCQ